MADLSATNASTLIGQLGSATSVIGRQKLNEFMSLPVCCSIIHSEYVEGGSFQTEITISQTLNSLSKCVNHKSLDLSADLSKPRGKHSQTEAGQCTSAMSPRD